MILFVTEWKKEDERDEVRREVVADADCASDRPGVAVTSALGELRGLQRTNGWGSHGMVTWNRTDFVAEASSVALSNHLTSAQADTHQRPRWRCIRFERDSQESNHILRLRPIVDQS